MTGVFELNRAGVCSVAGASLLNGEMLWLGAVHRVPLINLSDLKASHRYLSGLKVAVQSSDPIWLFEVFGLLLYFFCRCNCPRITELRDDHKWATGA